MNWFLIPFLAVVYAGVAGDPMASDKAAHFGAGYAISDMASEAKLPPWACAVSALTLGAAKESFDASQGGAWDARDFGCTVLGSVTQITVHW